MVNFVLVFQVTRVGLRLFKGGFGEVQHGTVQRRSCGKTLKAIHPTRNTFLKGNLGFSVLASSR
jgi:hypothetical protein